MASAGNAFANFGAGFLGGYRDILAMKMKEDSQSKRDEALANRQMNLEKLRQEFEGTQRSEDRGLRQQEITNTKEYHAQQLGLQEKQLAAQQASAAASRASASASLQEQIRHHKALEDSSNPVKQYEKGLEIKDRELERIKNPDEKALFESSGFMTYKEYQVNKGKMDSDVLKERADIAAKAVENVEKAVEASGKDVIEYGAELGVKGKSAADVMTQLKYHAAASSIASYDAVMGRGPKVKEPSAPATSTPQAPMFNEVAVKNFASAIMDANSGKLTEEQADKFNREVLPNYKKLSPEQQEEIQREINSRKSRPGVLRGLSSDIYSAFSKE